MSKNTRGTDEYGHGPPLLIGWRGVFVVWVLRHEGGTRYVVGDNAIPTDAQCEQVIARIGPLAFEEGEGLAPFQGALEAGMKRNRERVEREFEISRMRALVRAEYVLQQTAQAPPNDGKGMATGGTATGLDLASTETTDRVQGQV